MSQRGLGIALVRLKTLHLHPHSFFRDKASLRTSQIAFHPLLGLAGMELTFFIGARMVLCLICDQNSVDSTPVF